MKKVKNPELKENDSSSEHIKKGKIKKNKLKKDKILKDAVSKSDDLNLAPTETSNNVADKTKPNKKNKSNLKKNQESGKERKIGANKECNTEKSEKSQKSKNNDEKQGNSKAEIPLKKLSDSELKKIEKKKAKKLAQKLRKQQKKEESKDQLKTVASNLNGVLKTNEPDTTASKQCDVANRKVLTKKGKTVQKTPLTKHEDQLDKKTRDPAIEESTVFVGNLPVNTKRVQLVRLFKDFAPINSIRLRSAAGKLLFKHKQRKSAGSLNAYVVLKSKETAEKATSLNGVEFKGQHLRVTLATKLPQSHEKDAKRTVFVGNLTYSASEESLREIFSSCGEIDYVRCIRDGDKGCKGIAYVCFKTPDAVGLALELNETVVNDRPINVERFSVKKLGAKEKRDALVDKKEKKATRKMLNGKKKEKAVHKADQHSRVEDAKKPKKSNFKGVKIEGLKKKDKSKKKKSNDQMLQLAKKIAPKNKT